MERARNKILAAWKWTFSFVAKEWNLEHYPVVVRRQEPDEDPMLAPPRFVPQTYWAFIVGANLGGGGDTSEAALSSLQTNFALWKQTRLAEGKGIPRPGTTVPIEFADSSKVDAHAALAEDFIQRVLQLEWALITDESSLWDFHGEANNDELNARVRDVYGVNVSDIESGRLYLILERIAASHPEIESGNIRR